MTAIDAIEQVALVTGRLLHRGSGRPIDGSVRFDAVEGRVYGRVLEDGTFVVTGHPPLLMRGPAPWKLRLRIRVQSSELTTRVVTEELTVNNVTPGAMVNVGTLSFPMTASAVKANIARTIRGVVVEDKDPHPVVAGAQIEISDSVPSSVNTVTDAHGRFSFDDLIVAGPATIKCTAPPFKTQTRQLLIDFHFAMHEVHFRLVK